MFYIRYNFCFTAPSTQAALLKRIEQLEAELQATRRRLRLAQKQRCEALAAKKHLTAGLKKYMNEDQMKSLEKKTMKGTRWSKKTIIKALKVRLSCGARGYDAVKELGQPLPSERTLQRHLERYKFAPGLLYDIMESLALKVCADMSLALTIDTCCGHSCHCLNRPTYNFTLCRLTSCHQKSVTPP